MEKNTVVEAVVIAVASEMDLHMVQTENCFRGICKEFIAGERKDFELSEKDNLDVYNSVRGDTEIYQCDGGQYAGSVADMWLKRFKEWNVAL